MRPCCLVMSTLAADKRFNLRRTMHLFSFNAQALMHIPPTHPPTPLLTHACISSKIFFFFFFFAAFLLFLLHFFLSFFSYPGPCGVQDARHKHPGLQPTSRCHPHRTVAAHSNPQTLPQACRLLLHQKPCTGHFPSSSYARIHGQMPVPICHCHPARFCGSITLY